MNGDLEEFAFRICEECPNKDCEICANAELMKCKHITRTLDYLNVIEALEVKIEILSKLCGAELK